MTDAYADMDIRVESVDGNQMAAKVTGRFSMGGHSFGFTAIAFGRIGGQNVGVKLAGETEGRLADLGYDPGRTIDELQRNLVRGNLSLPPGLKRESFADG